MKQWVVMAKKADFDALAQQFHISPMLARIIRNRDMVTPEEIGLFLNGTLDDLYDPMRLYGMREAADMLEEAVREGSKIRVIGDYDVDGVCSTYILVTALKRMGAEVSWQLPDRMVDGYGLNARIVEKAHEDQIDLILTCDNGIAAVSEIALAKEYGMKVIVTDHHEAPPELPCADVIVDPKQPACSYPYPEICGAVVAWKLVQVLSKDTGIQMPADHLQFAALATVCDVMPLLHENRIIVRYGLEAMRGTENTGLGALMDVTKCSGIRLSPYHAGFILGPCVNATGRLDLAGRALNLFLSEDRNEAVTIARELQELNESRRNMTLQATDRAIRIVREGDAVNPVMEDDRVLVVYMPDCHESIAGIVAGKVKEAFYRPTIVLTGGNEPPGTELEVQSAENEPLTPSPMVHIVKGSARSIEAYNMFEALCAISELFTKFGGHKMAAGLSLPKDNIGELRRRLNENAHLTAEELTEKVKIDIPMPIRYVTREFVAELERLGPFGNGNPTPNFAQKGLVIADLEVRGENRNVVNLRFEHETAETVWFGDGNAFAAQYHTGDKVSVVYQPKFREYRGVRSIQMQIKEIKPDTT